jgi:hypothetical protein
MKTNVKPAKIHTHEGAVAVRISPIEELRRTVSACLLWESSFYESGVSIADRIQKLALEVDLNDLIALISETRDVHKLRHAPLMLLAAMLQRSDLHTFKGSIPDVIAQNIRRADEMGELLAMHAQLTNTPVDKLKKILPAKLKKGLAKAFNRFDAYQLGKYNRPDGIKLRDVMLLTHPKPSDDAQAAVWKSLLDGTLASPDTWEVALSGGADKRETFTRLLTEQNIGYMALLKNLRGMLDAGVDADLVREAIIARRQSRYVLPFRYIAAARACPRMEPAIDQAICEMVSEIASFDGETIIIVDVSGSMEEMLSKKSDLRRLDAAAGLASLFMGKARVLTFSSKVVEVPHRLGMAGVDKIFNSQDHRSSDMHAAVALANTMKHDRLIVISDEKVNRRPDRPVAKKAYMVNVGSSKNGVGYRDGWTHIDGFSEGVFRFIHEAERMKSNDEVSA